MLEPLQRLIPGAVTVKLSSFIGPWLSILWSSWILLINQQHKRPVRPCPYVVCGLTARSRTVVERVLVIKKVWKPLDQQMICALVIVSCMQSSRVIGGVSKQLCTGSPCKVICAAPEWNMNSVHYTQQAVINDHPEQHIVCLNHNMS